jgi:hypothetical protein
MGLVGWFKDTKNELSAALAVRRAAKQYERDVAMGYKREVSIIKGLKAIASLALFSGLAAAFVALAEPGVLEAILSNAGVNSAYVGLIVLALRGLAAYGSNWLKHSPNAPKASNGDLPALFLIALLPTMATAQEPTPSPMPVEINLHGGAMQFAERGVADKRDFVYRLTLTVPGPSRLILFGRADYTRTQDGGDLLDIKTFRSIEALAGGRGPIATNLEVMAFGGVTWNRDAKVEPTDPRLWTAAAGLKYSVPGRGYVIAAAGHHGPVGGSAFLGSLVYEINSGASWFGDIAIPLDASRFAVRPYTIKAGISARLKSWKF